MWSKVYQPLHSANSLDTELGGMPISTVYHRMLIGETRPVPVCKLLKYSVAFASTVR